jgi:hypothetical protein
LSRTVDFTKELAAAALPNISQNGALPRHLRIA